MLHRTDERIAEEVRGALGFDRRLRREPIAATVTNGVVTLSGTVSRYGARVDAAETAQRIRGVREVFNDLAVETSPGTTRSDAAIARSVRRALERAHSALARRVTATVSGGWVTLRGTVARLGEGDDVERALRYVAGIRGVIDRIEVAGRPVDASDVRGAIEDVLERRAKRGARHIRIDVDDHTITLSGTVESWLEKRAVLGVVRHTLGVRAVNDHLEVAAPPGAA